MIQHVTKQYLAAVLELQLELGRAIADVQKAALAIAEGRPDGAAEHIASAAATIKEPVAIKMSKAAFMAVELPDAPTLAAMAFAGASWNPIMANDQRRGIASVRLRHKLGLASHHFNL